MPKLIAYCRFETVNWIMTGGVQAWHVIRSIGREANILPWADIYIHIVCSTKKTTAASRHGHLKILFPLCPRLPHSYVRPVSALLNTLLLCT